MTTLTITRFRPFSKDPRVNLLLVTNDGVYHAIKGTTVKKHDVEHVVFDLGYSELDEDQIQDIVYGISDEEYNKLSDENKQRYDTFCDYSYDADDWFNLFSEWSVATPFSKLEWSLNPPSWFKIVVTVENEKVVVKCNYLEAI